MGRAALQACLPWAALLAVAVVAAYLLVRLSRLPIRLGRLRHLHRNQAGSAQSLSFVLTLPLFVMVILLIVQISQLMIGTVVVHYAAFAAARSAIVWIPAGLESPEGENCIGYYYPDPQAPDQVFPSLDPQAGDYGPAAGGVTCRIEPGSQKFEKITSAAVLACISICPSRDLGMELQGGDTQAVDILRAAYAGLAPSSQENARIPARLENKLAYAMQNTEVEIRFFHSNREPPLVPHYVGPDYSEFRLNEELGWQDQITVTVKHDLALLPGPGRLLAREVTDPDGSPDEVARSIRKGDGVYVYRLEASATMGNEGEKSVIPYGYYAY